MLQRYGCFPQVCFWFSMLCTYILVFPNLSCHNCLKWCNISYLKLLLIREIILSSFNTAELFSMTDDSLQLKQDEDSITVC